MPLQHASGLPNKNNNLDERDPNHCVFKGYHKFRMRKKNTFVVFGASKHSRDNRNIMNFFAYKA